MGDFFVKALEVVERSVENMVKHPVATISIMWFGSKLLSKNEKSSVNIEPVSEQPVTEEA